MKTKLNRTRKRELRDLHNRFWAFLLTFAMLLQSTPLQAYASVLASDEALDQLTEPLAEDTDQQEAEVITQEEGTDEAALVDEGVAQEPAVDEVVDEAAAPQEEAVVEDAAPAEQSAPQEEQPAEPQETVPVAFTVANATVSIGDMQITEAGEVNATKGQELSFSVAAVEDYALVADSVVAIIDGNEIPVAASEDGSYRIAGDSVHEGTAVRVTAAKKVYTYEDDNLKVTATLEDPTAIPSDATLAVSAVTSQLTQDEGLYNYDTYMEALNKAAEAPEDQPVYTQENTLLYDVAFLTINPETGEPVELQPEEGKVAVKFEFKQQQLTENLEVTEAQDVNVIHLPLKDEAKAETTSQATDIVADDVVVQPVADKDFAAEGDSVVEVVATDFSIFAVTNPLTATNNSDYTVVINIDPAGLNVVEGDHYYLWLRGKPGTSLADTYYLGKLKIDAAQTQFKVPIQYHEGNQLKVNWQDGNGNTKNNARISNANDVEVYLLKSNSEINVNTAIQRGNNCSWLKTGDVIKTYGIEIAGTTDSGNAVTSTINLKDTAGSLNGALTPETILGDAMEFGITATRYEQKGHSETNFAVKAYDNIDNSNIDVDGSGDVDVPFYAGTIVSNDLWLSEKNKANTYVYVGEGSKNKIDDRTPSNIKVEVKAMPENQINGYVDMLIGAGQSMSDFLASQTTITPSLNDNQNRYVLDTRSFPDGTTIFVNADGLLPILQNSDGLRIEKLPNQSIVFNITANNTPGSDAVKISRFTVNDGVHGDVDTHTAAVDGDADWNQLVDDVIFEHITFNVTNAQNVDLDTAAGLFLCPHASYVTQRNGAGWILAGGTVHSESEWHFYRHKRHYHAQGMLVLNAHKKIVDGNGNVIAFENRNFGFELYRVNNGKRGTSPIETTTANASNGEVIFKSIYYTEADVPAGQTRTFTYDIVEVIPPKAVNAQGRTYESYAGTGIDPNTQGPFAYEGISYTGQPIRLDVEATNPGSGGSSDQITVKVKLSGGSGYLTPIDTANNVYDVGDVTNQKTTVSTPLKVKKNDDYPWGASDSFTFTLKAVDGAPMPDGSTDGAKTVRVSSTNAVTFGSIKYTAAGTYKYTITETVPDDATAMIGGALMTYADAKDHFNADMVAAAQWKDARGVTYDAKVHNITVTVSNSTPMTVTVADDQDANVSAANPTATFTNSREDKGSLKLRKGLLIDGLSPDSEDEAEAEYATKYISYTDGTYYFEVAGAPRTPTQAEGRREVAITIKDGKVASATVDGKAAKVDSQGYVEIEGLTPGTYLVNELTNKNTNKDAHPYGHYSDVQVTVTSGRSGYAVLDSGKATISNNYRTGSIKIRKRVLENGAAPSAAAMSILKGTYTFGVFTDELCKTPAKDADGNAITLTLTIDGDTEVMSEEIRGLKPGDYWVKETMPTNGSSPTQNPILVTVTAGQTGQASAIVTIANSLDTGEFTVKKTVVSNKSGDKDTDFNFTVTLSNTNINGTYGEMDFTNGVATFKLKDGQTKKATNLPLGITYTVKEERVDGFVTTVGSVKTYESKGTVKSFATADTVDFTNQREKGDIELSKVLVSDRAADSSTKFTFTVTLSDKGISGKYGDATFSAGVATVTLIGGQKANITGLPTGITYEITEAEATGFVQTGKVGDTGTIRTTKSTATFTNTREPGSLTVTKKVVSSSEADKNTDFYFRVVLTGLSSDAANKTYKDSDGNDVKFTGGVATFSLKGDQTKKIEGLPTGVDYEVYELATSTSTTAGTPKGWVMTASGNTSGTITSAGANVTFTNTKDEGGLAVYKSVVSTLDTDKTKDYGFTVTLSDTSINGTYGTGDTAMTFTNGVATFTLKDGEYKLASGLPEKITYTVVEDDPGSEFTTKWTGEIEKGKTVTKDGRTTEGTDLLPLANQTTKAVRYTNSHIPGKITINKKVVSPIPAERTQLFTFTIQLTDANGDPAAVNGTFSDVTFTDGVATLQVAGGSSKTIEGLPVGVSYVVTEATVQNFTMTKVSGDTGTITAAGTTASFENSRDVTDFTVSKEVISDAAADAKQEFTFTVTLSDKTITGTFGAMKFTNGVATFTLKGGDSAKATGLPKGVTYEVTEAIDNNFVTESTNAKGTFGDPQLVAAFKNTRKTGNLDIEKIVESSTETDKTERTFKFQVRLSDETINKTYNGIKFTNGVSDVFELKHNESVTIEGLPTGIGYRVTEETATGFNTIKTGETGTITTTESTAHFTNSRDEGGLVVYKKVNSPIPGDKNIKFDFIVTLDDNKINGKYGDMTFVDGVAKFQLADSQQAQATGLPQGTGYTVVEDLTAAQTEVFATTWEGSVAKGGKISNAVATVKCINTHKPGDLKITKKVNSTLTTDKTKKFEFQIELSNKTISGTFGDVTFTDGFANFQLSMDQTVTVKGLPKGVLYKVTETESTPYLTTIDGAIGTINPDRVAVATATATNDRLTTRTTVLKVWNDNNNQDGKRTNFINVILTVNGSPVSTARLDKDHVDDAGNWVLYDAQTNKQTWIEGLPVYDDEGKPYVYEWVEDPTTMPKDADGRAIYTTKTVTSTDDTTGYITSTITNTYKPETTTAKILKVWDDGGNQDRLRPETLSVSLMKQLEGESTATLVKTYTLDATMLEQGDANKWALTIDDLPVYENGKLITYSWVEDSVPKNYTLKSITTTGDGTQGYITTATNYHKPYETNARVLKVWNDKDDRDAARPKEITVTLLADGQPAKNSAGKDVSQVTLNAANKWFADVTNLPQKKDGKDITYTWTEDEATLKQLGYTLTSKNTTGTLTTLTNTYEPEDTPAEVLKVWKDDEDRDGMRPDDLQVVLLADGVVAKWDEGMALGDDADYGKKNKGQSIVVTLTKDNDWTAKVDKLPKNKNVNGVKTPIKYVWNEFNVPAGYTLIGNTTEGTITTLTNEHKITPTQAQILKIWNDKDDRDKLRPTQILVKLMADGVQATWADGMTLDGTAIEADKAGQPIEFVLEESNGWRSPLVGNLPKNKNDGVDVKPISYTWQETGVDDAGTAALANYAQSGTTSGILFRLTNTYNPETTEATVKKVWNDDNDRDAIRPASLQVALLADGMLASWDEGMEYDGNVNFGKEHKGDPIVITLIVSADGKWASDISATIKGLPKNNGGKAVKYTWTEVEVPAGYTLESPAAVDGTITTLTNTHKITPTTASVRKVWNDNEDQDKVRPESLTVKLLADDQPAVDINGDAIDPVVLSADNGWVYRVSNLPKNKNVDGKPVEINYTWTEEKVPDNYTLDGTAKDGTVTTITNTHEPEKTWAQVIKAWNGDENNRYESRPAKLRVGLTADGVNIKWRKGMGLNGVPISDGMIGKYIYVDLEPAAADSDTDQLWPMSDVITGLDKYNNGVEIQYMWVENTEPDTEGALPSEYTLTNYETDSMVDGRGVRGVITTLTNTYKTEHTGAFIRKIWNDNDDQDKARPAEITVRLLQDGQPINWAAGMKTGTGTKAVDIDPSLYGKPIEVTLKASEGWAYTIGGLVTYKDVDKTQKYEYTWAEDEAYLRTLGYTMVDNTTSGAITAITNERRPETTTAKVSKIWDDHDNQDVIRPDSVQVALLGDGMLVNWADGMTLNGVAHQGTGPLVIDLTPDANGNWPEAVVDGLPKNKNGKAITYNWVEVEVPEGYELVSQKDSTEKEGEAITAYVTTITNKHNPEPTTASVRKVWNDNENQDGFRPATLTVNLLADGVAAKHIDGKPVAAVELSAANSWVARVENLPKYKNENGKAVEIKYTWTEGSPFVKSGEDYVYTKDGKQLYKLESNVTEGTITTITNTHEPEPVKASVKKDWRDNNNQDGKRDKITAVLVADNAPAVWADGMSLKQGDAAADANYGKTNAGSTITVELNESNKWGAEVDGLPKYNNGKLINYFWQETTRPDGYTLISSDTVLKDVDGHVVTQNDPTVVEFDTTLVNQYEPEKTPASVVKVWNDNEDQDGFRPEGLKVTLQADGKTVNWADGMGLVTDVDDPDFGKNNATKPVEVTLTAASSWSARVTGLPKFRDGGTAIKYTWVEDEETLRGLGYTMLSNVTDNTTYVTTLTNVHEPETVPTVVDKIWKDNDNQDGIRPDSIRAILVAGDSFGVWAQGMQYMLGKNATWTNVEADNIGKQIIVELNEDNDWHAEVKGLPKRANGQEIQYYWAEVVVPDDYTVQDGEQYTTKDFTTTITNTHEPEKTEASVKKVWRDQNDIDGWRPLEITARLYKDGVATDTTVKLNKGNKWTATVTGLDKFRDNGTEIKYTFNEIALERTFNEDTYRYEYGDEVAGVLGDDEYTTWPRGIDPWIDPTTLYTLVSNVTVGNTTTLTNVHEPETTNVWIEKVWNDADDQDGYRPISLTMNLLSGPSFNDQTPTGRSVILTSANDWFGKIDNLPVYDNGKRIMYSWAEGDPFIDEKDDEGWSHFVMRDSDGRLIYDNDGLSLVDYTTRLVNTHEPDPTTATVKKVWESKDTDAEGNIINKNGENLLPEKLDVVLLADGEPAVDLKGNDVSAVTLTADNKWEYTVEDLPKFRKDADAGIGGIPVEYTWVEDEQTLADLGYTLTSNTTEEGETGTITTLTNTLNTGGLTVKKVIKNAVGAANVNKEFTFTVTLVGTKVEGTYGDMVFDPATDGRNASIATFKLKGGKSATATNLPAGTHYTVDEVLTDADKAQWTASWSGDVEGDIVADSTPTVTCTNENIHGVLAVKKVVTSSAANDHTKDFTFTVELRDKTINGTYGQLEFKDGVATFTLKDGETKFADGLPVGLAYDVTETADAGFVTSWTNNVVTRDNSTTTKDNPTPMSIVKEGTLYTFTNERNTGAVAINKAVVSPIPAEQDAEYEFTIRVVDSAGTPIANGDYPLYNSDRSVGTVAFNNGVATIKVAGNDSKAIGDLPEDAKYTVTEIGPQDLLANMTTTSEGAEGTITTGGTGMVTFTNTHTPGELDVTKKVISTTQADLTKAYHIKVELADKTISGEFGDMVFNNGVVEFDLADGETMHAEGLPVAVDYTVTETKADGFTTTYTGNTGTISENKSECVVTNAKIEGGLMVTKEVKNGLPSDKDQEFTFMVTLSDTSINNTYPAISGVSHDDEGLTFTNGIAHFTLKDGQTKAVEGLPAGVTFEVYETVNDNFVTEWSGTEGAQDADHWKGTVTKDPAKVASVHVTNRRILGTLDIAKKLISESAADKDQVFTFTVTLMDGDQPVTGVFSGVSFNEKGQATITLKADEHKVLNDLPNGATYTVTEADTPEFERTGAIGDTGVISTTAATATITNSRITGNLSVSKRVLSDVATDLTDREFTFTVKLSDESINQTFSGVKFVNGVGTFTLKADETKLIEKLPSGVAYEVTEASTPNFELLGISGDEKGVITTTTSSVEFTNARELGKLKLAKSQTSWHPHDEGEVFTFRVYLDAIVNATFGDITFAEVTDSTGAGLGFSSAEVNITAGESVTIEDLPVGVGYKIIEVNEDDSEEFDIAGIGFDGVITKDGSGSEDADNVDAYNIDRDGNLEVVKTIKNGVDGDEDLDFYFEVKMLNEDGALDSHIDGRYGEMYFIEGVAEFSLTAGQRVAAKGLPVGARFEVEEKTEDGFEPSFVVSGTGEAVKSNKVEGTISDDETKTVVVECINERVYGDLTVSKRLFSARAADANQLFNFTIDLVGNATVNGTYGDITFEDGVAQVQLRGGESATATKLPAGMLYTVTEAETPGFILNARTDYEGTITTSGVNATFTNTRIDGGFDVTKKVNSPVASDKQADFNFKVTLSDTSINGEHGDMTFANGVATFTLKDGETKRAANLPTDVTFTVEETANEDFTTSWTGSVSGEETAKGTTVKTDALDIVNAGTSVVFTNDRVLGDLGITKTVVGTSDQIDPKQEFTFTVTLEGQIGTQINGTFGDLTFKDGVATTTLKAGENKVASGLPAGVPYTVAETGVAGYTTTSVDAMGTIPADGTVTAQFTNYWPTGEAKLFATKSLTGRAMQAGEFKFELLNGKGEVISTAANGEVAEDGTATVTFDAITYNMIDLAKTNDDGTIVEPVAYETSKDFSYTIAEVVPDNAVNAKGETYAEATDKNAAFVLDGITYQRQPQAVTVTVATSNPMSDKLVVTYDGKDTFAGVAFANTYAPTGEGEVLVKKNLTGRDWTDGDKFEFTLAAEGEAPMPEATTITIDSKTADYTQSFGKIKFTAPGEYKYTVTETKGDAKGMSYDTAAHEITFNVVDDGKGNLVASEGTQLVQTAEITNKYNAQGKGEIKIKKTLNGRKWTKGDQFSFTLSSVDGTPMPAKSQITITDTTKQYTDTFGAIQFTQPGTYTYKVKEVAGNIQGITYDQTEHEVTIEVVDDGKGNLIAAEGSSLDNTIEIINPYKPQNGDLIVRKTVSSSTASDTTRDFIFKVTLSDTTISGKYGDMEFKDGVATFTLKHNQSKEATGLPAGVTYKVEETDAGGLTSSMAGGTGTIMASKKASASCTNRRPTPPTTPPTTTPKTDDIFNPALAGMLFGGGLMLLALAYLRRKREQEA